MTIVDMKLLIFFVLILSKNMLFTGRPKSVSDLSQAYNLNFSRQYKINN